MGKLPEKIQTELETWMDKQEQLKKQAVVSLDIGNVGKKQAAITRKIWE
jgi:hypothetical protein